MPSPPSAGAARELGPGLTDPSAARESGGVNGAHRRREAAAGMRPLRERAPVEFACALTTAVTLASAMMCRAWALSARYDPGLGSGATGGMRREVRPLPGLTEGWFMGRMNDLSDHQWRTFRANLPTLVAVLAVTVPTVTAVRRWAPEGSSVPFHAVYGVGFVVYLHGVRAVWILGLALTHFAVCRACAGVPRVGALGAWMSGCGLLAVVQFWSESWHFGAIGLDAMDGWYQGAMPRWWVHYNLLTLRLIGYGMDLHWRRGDRVGPSCPGKRTSGKNGSFGGVLTSVSVISVATPAPASASAAVVPASSGSSAVPFTSKSAATTGAAAGGYFHLVEHPSPDVDYSFLEFVAFIFYPPLYLAGPNSSFNAFASQIRDPQRSHSHIAVARYAFVKLVLIVLATEIFTHTIYANAMATSREWSAERGGFGPADVGITSLMTLNFMWFKFAVIWRFFRLWALMSGVEVPENMLRCVNNNSTILGFWRGWHASYNRWLVRYLYVPLGGSKYKLLNVWVVFGFVGMWHDRLRWRLLYWAAIFALFLAPELAVQAAGRVLFPSPEARDTAHYRLLRAFAGALNIHVLIAGNMVGYVVGLDGMWDAFRIYASPAGVWFVMASLAVMTAAAHLGFEQREGEDRVRQRAKVW